MPQPETAKLNVELGLILGGLLFTEGPDREGAVKELERLFNAGTEGEVEYIRGWLDGWSKAHELNNVDFSAIKGHKQGG